MKTIIKHYVRICINKKTVLELLLLMVIGAILPTGGGSLQKLQLMYTNVGPLLIMYISALLISSEFEWNTYKATFTGKYSRMDILIMKLLSAFVIAALLGVIQCAAFKAASVYDGVSFGLSDASKTIGCLLLFTLFICSVGFLAAVLCRSFIGTFTVLFILFFDFFKDCLAMAAEGIRNDGLKEFILNIPLCDALYGLQMNRYSAESIVNMSVVSVIGLVLAGILLHKRDL